MNFNANCSNGGGPACRILRKLEEAISFSGK